MTTQLYVPPNKKLTKEVAYALAKKVKETGKIAGQNEKAIDIQVKNAVTGELELQTLSVQTIRSWTSKNIHIIGSNKGFGEYIEEAKNVYRKMKASTENKGMLQRARRNLVQLLDDDTQSDGGFIGITSKRDPKTGKRIEVQRYKQKFIGTDPIKFREKAKATLTVLEKLDPAFKKDSENTVNVNLSFLSLSEKRQEMIKLGKIKTV